MLFFQPTLPEYDLETWRTRPFPERARLACKSWAMQGYGTPLGLYLAYALKVAAYVGGWWFFCTRTPELAGSPISAWWASPVAFGKAILWTLAFESMGFGCGSGPLTGRYVPPVGGLLYFLRPGTTKLPMFAGWPIIGSDRRRWWDVGAYLVWLLLAFRALFAPGLAVELLLPIVVMLPLLGVLDKTLFLSARAEHYGSVLLCMLFAGQWIAGAKVVWLAIWWWAATSKVNAHFPAVMAVMTSNAPLLRSRWVKSQLYRDFPHDLRPSRSAAALAHLGTALEYLFPVLLLLGDGGVLTLVGLGVMLAFHGFIMSNVPMGVPIEWNVLMMYGAVVLFGVHADVGVLSLSAPLLIGWLVAFHLVLPILGSVYPERLSFLLSMRYYAGNWAWSLWLFRGDSVSKLDDRIVKSSPTVRRQLAMLYDEGTIELLLSKVVAFRLMHLHGRLLHDLLPQAVDDVDDYEWVDGEIVAGLVLGWNFGDGHLHHHQLLASVQDQCQFESGELRCIFVESQPIHRRVLAWRIHDAADGELARGEAPVAPLLDRQPWPTPTSVPTR